MPPRSWLVLAVLIAASEITWAHGGSEHLRGEVTVAERAAFAAARQAFERHCLRCHTNDGKKAKARAHLNMTTYPFTGHHAGEAGDAIRTVLGEGPKGKRATMPSDNPGVVAGEDLKLILAWADAFNVAHRSGAAGGPKHEH